MRKGQVGALVGIMLAVIIGVGVTIPVAISVIGSTNFTGFTLTQTIVTFIPTLVGAVLIVGTTAVMGLRK